MCICLGQKHSKEKAMCKGKQTIPNASVNSQETRVAIEESEKMRSVGKQGPDIVELTG